MAGKKKMFEDRVEEAREFIIEGETVKAISTLKKAIKNDPDKDVDGKISKWVEELENKKSIEIVIDETIVNSTNDDNEDVTEVIVTKVVEVKEPELEDEIEFQILRPMNIASVLYKHPEIVTLPRSYKDLQGGFLIAVEDQETTE